MSTHYKGTPEEIRALNTFIKLTRAHDSLMARLSAGTSLDSLTISQFGTLEVLYHLGPLCQNTLGSKILKSNSNMTTVIDNLEKRGLVKRERDAEDRRMIFVHLTPSGRELIEAVLPQHIRAITEQFSHLTPEEHATLGELLRKLGKRDT
jgi:MarR family 2-MHQ and catechol resistance regulon transcriptional repressor